MSTVLDVNDLVKWFPIKGGLLGRTRGYVKAVDGVSFDVRKGETFGLVGESGCGKTTVGRAILRLTEPTSGQVLFQGQDVTKMKRDQLREIRKKMQIVFQDPYASLDPRQTIKGALTEPMRINKLVQSGEEARARAADLIRRVGLNDDHLYRFPHEFSGGQRQRIAVARTLAVDPEFIVLDEPTSFLDVSVQAQILNLLTDLQHELGLTYLFISHNLSVIKHMSNRVGVMYLGTLVEVADKETIYERPKHPYTHALISAIPIANPEYGYERVLLTGDVPSPVNIPPGCRFHARCRYATEKCKKEVPPLREIAGDHLVACHYAEELKLEIAVVARTR